jgi:FkbM family methyltransferase
VAERRTTSRVAACGRKPVPSRLERVTTRTLELAVRALSATIGRQNVVRMARFLDYRARLDFPNDPRSSGEALFQRAVLRRASQSDRITIVDVGANVGDWTASLLCAAEQMDLTRLRVYALEPSPDSYARLCQALGPYIDAGTVVPSQLGASSRNGSGTLYAYGPTAQTNSMYPDHAVHSGQEFVKLCTLDAYAQEIDLERITMVKIDTEGHDFEVLLGADQLLRRAAIDVVQFEYNWRWISARRYLRDAFELILPLGYFLGKIVPGGVEFYSRWDRELETFHEANYAIISPTWKGAFRHVPWWNERAPSMVA